MRREGAKKGGSKNKDTTMPKVKGSYSSRYTKKDDKSRGKIESISPTYPSRYK